MHIERVQNCRIKVSLLELLVLTCSVISDGTHGVK